MWVHISKLARDNRLPEESLTALAMRNQARYAVILDAHGPKVEAKAAKKLVEEYRALQANSGGTR